MTSFPTTGRAAMPIPGTRNAPDTFDGNDLELADFLDQFEALAESAKLTDKEKVLQIRRYASRKEQHLFEVLDGYASGDWNLFKASLIDLYPRAFRPKRYTRQDLEAYTAKAAKREILDEGQLHTYFRGFITIARWLVTNQKLTEEERDCHFWSGFHQRNRKNLKFQLRISHPDHDPSAPYDYKIVYKAAQILLAREAFDLNFPGNASQSDEDTESDDDAPLPAQKKTRNPDAQDNDLESLVTELSALQTHDTQYAITFAKIARYHPTVARLLSQPSAESAAPPQPALPVAVHPTPAPPPVPAHPTAAPPPVPYHAAPYRANVPSAIPPYPAYAPRAKGPWPCAFCKRQGCFTITCNIAAQYIQEGKIKRTDRWYRWPDNTVIRTHKRGIQFVVDSVLESRAVQQARSSSVPPRQPSRFVRTPDTTAPGTNHPEAFIVEIKSEEDDKPASTPSGHSKTAKGSKAAQYKFRARTDEAHRTLDAIYDKILDTTVALPLRDVLAASPDMRRRLVKDCTAATKMPDVTAFTVVDTADDVPIPKTSPPGDVPYKGPRRELDVALPRKNIVVGVFSQMGEAPYMVL